MVGYKHPSIWTAIETLQLDCAEMQTILLQHNAGNLAPKKQTREYQQTQSRIKKICIEYQQKKRTMEQFLTAVGQCIQFKRLIDDLLFGFNLNATTSSIKLKL